MALTPTVPPLLARPIRPIALVEVALDKATDIISHPTPEYPAKALSRHLSGSGVYELQVLEETGEISSVTVITSTGYPILDSAAVSALKRWRLRAHTAVRVKVPISFNLKKHSTGGG